MSDKLEMLLKGAENDISQLSVKLDQSDSEELSQIVNQVLQTINLAHNLYVSNFVESAEHGRMKCPIKECECPWHRG